MLSFILTLATVTLVPAAGSPFVHVQVGSGALTIHTWNRPQIRVFSSNRVRIMTFAAADVRSTIGATLPIYAKRLATPSGTLTLPEEEFPVEPNPGEHAGIIVRPGDAHVDLTLPKATWLLFASILHGPIVLQDFSGSFLIDARRGSVRIRGASGIGYVELLDGPVVIANSTFTWLRARTALGRIVFRNSRFAQVQSTSIRGSLIAQGGAFERGVAQFRTSNGDIALSVGSQSFNIRAHSGAGHIMSAFPAHWLDPQDAIIAQGVADTVISLSTDRGSIAVLAKGLPLRAPSGRRAAIRRARQ